MYAEQVFTMCSVPVRQLSLSYFLSYFPLMVSGAVSCQLYNLKTLWYIMMILYSYVEQVHFILSELFPFDGFRCNFVSAL